MSNQIDLCEKCGEPSLVSNARGFQFLRCACHPKEHPSQVTVQFTTRRVSTPINGEIFEPGDVTREQVERAMRNLAKEIDRRLNDNAEELYAIDHMKRVEATTEKPKGVLLINA